MKPSVRNVVHSVGDVQEETRMSIDQESLAHIMNLLTDLYSDRQMAVIREYASNALDSHIEAGNPDPIEVTLPTSFNPNLIITDRGVGLTVDDMRDIYSMYGRSTKRDTNDAVGMLGLGCKSGLTYALSFTVTAVKNGVRTVAVVTKDSDGVGIIKILDTMATDEPNGVTVSIPVDSYDISSFRYKADQLFKFWKPGTVLVNGEEPEFNEVALWLDEDVLILPEHGQSHIVMGNVPYPFRHELGAFPHSIVAWVPIGSVDFAPSREALMDTNLTKATIKQLEEFVEERFTEVIKEKMEELETAYERIEFAYTWRSTSQVKAILKDFKYVIEPPEDKVIWSKAWRGFRKYDHALGTETILGNKPIITEYPNKTIPPAHRDRIEEIGLNLNGLLILPEGADLTALEGRENVYSWDHVLKNTTDPPKATRGPRIKQTKWNFRYMGKNFHEELDLKAPIAYYGMREHGYIYDHPECQIVQLYAKDVKRFCKMHPTATSISQYRTKLATDSEKKITETDLIKNAFVGYNTDIVFKNLKDYADRIDDVDVRTIIKAVNSEFSKAYQDFHKVRGYGAIKKSSDLLKRVYSNYPLLKDLGASADPNEMVFYINSKTASAV